MRQITPFEIGQKFYYTGDMANDSDFGEITEVHPPTKYTQLRYTVLFDSGKTRIVDHFAFNVSPGQRFKTIEQYNRENADKTQYLNNLFQKIGSSK